MGTICAILDIPSQSLEHRADEMKVWMDELAQKELQQQLVEKVKHSKKTNRKKNRHAEEPSTCQKQPTADVPPAASNHEVNDKQVLQAYLVTWSAPQEDSAEDTADPSTYTREQVKCTMLQTLDECQIEGANKITVKKMAIFRERHKSGKEHYHIAVLLSGKKRWKPWKHTLQSKGIAVNFATCDSGGYHSAIRYCYMPRKEKLLAELDPTPMLYPNDHPPLFEAMNRSYTAETFQEEKILMKQKRSEKGQSEGRFKEADLWPILKEKDWRPEDKNFLENILLYARQSGGNDMINFCIRNYDSLTAVASRIWVMEEAPNRMQSNNRTRMQILEEAATSPCKCNGRWPRAARDLLRQNNISEAALTQAIFNNMERGRDKGTCVCLCGKHGNEGKSFMLAPLADIFQPEEVLRTPSPGTFPLLGIEKSRVLLWDDWRWNESVLKIHTMLLLLEGQPLHIARPQNRFGGHITWSGTSPVFITGRIDDLLKPKGQISAQDLEMLQKRRGVQSLCPLHV